MLQTSLVLLHLPEPSVKPRNHSESESLNMGWDGTVQNRFFGQQKEELGAV